ncbi:MAG: DUF1501 domain-containing protein, partial [Planctomycetes bacterium]|nr:DUF1501 domain-containing protein [Planctomycetota bacterium]
MSKPFSLNRRDFLRASAAAGGVIATSTFFSHNILGEESTVRKRNSKINHVILLFMEGGPSQLETFDPKPGK